MEYDEDNAIAFIRDCMSSEVCHSYDDDDILYVIDTIWDYYDSHGNVVYNDHMTEVEISALNDLISFVKKEIKKESELTIKTDDIETIVKAELEYENSIKIFDN